MNCSFDQFATQGNKLAGVSYEVTTPVFDGPFDLLLHLILRDEVDLYEVSLITIVDAYLSELSRLETEGLINLEAATEFLLIAATLVELKSRRLLPDESGIDLDEEFLLWEERDLLLARLLECKTFKDASVALQGLSRMAVLSFPRTAGLEEQFLGLMPDLLEGVDAKDLRQACIKALTPKPVPTVSTDHIAPIRLSVSDACEDVALTLSERGKMSFRDLTGALVDRIEVVIYFLAALELFKQGRVDIVQFSTFADISLEWLGDADDGNGSAFDISDIDSYEG